jgi:amino acid adenylation domain-containing protein
MSAPPRATDGAKEGAWVSLADRVREWARAQPARVAFVELDGDAQPISELTWDELDAGAQAVASALRQRVSAGARVVLAFSAGSGFAQALLGCFYAGAVAVPCAPPLRARAGSRALGVLEDSGAEVLLTAEELSGQIGRALDALDRPPACLTLESLLATEESARVTPLHRPARDEVAVLQYTSGSTSRPRGVAITHGNIAANVEMLLDWTAADRESVFLTWLPLYHDMGLVSGYLMPLLAGATGYLINPATFARRPGVWLRAASQVRATHSAAPNFAFELCASQVPEAETDGLDLGSLRWVLNAAEMIRRSTNEAFLARYAPLGFAPEALAQYYGLAEATVCVTGHPAGRGQPYLAVSGTALERGEVQEVAAEAPDRRWIAGCGGAGPGSAVAIVDPLTLAPLPDDTIGEVWATGPSMAAGYWDKPEATAETFGFALAGDSRPYFRTGDLGFRRDGELYLTGRLKELIVAGGRNLYPVDLEATVQDLDPRLVRDRGAAFALEQEGTEAVGLVQEIRREGDLDPDELARRAVQALAETHEVEVAAVVLIRQGTLPLTSSGKVQRGEARRRLLAGELKPLGSFRRDLAPAPAAAPPRRHGELVALLCEEVAAALDLDPAEIDPQEPLSRFGFGSMTAARLAERVGARVGVRLEATSFYDRPTVAAVAEWIAQQAPTDPLPDTPAPSDAPAPGPVSEADTDENAVALVGMACRLPGAPDLDSFWEALLDGLDGISEPPAARRELRAQFAALPEVPSQAGYLEEVELFDPAFFRMSKREADLLDPQHRLLLEASWHALEHAGLRPEELRGSRAGVFVGISTADYGELLGADAGGSQAHYPTGNAHNMAANRLSYLFDWRGPSFGVDTACSSSLVAVHLAMQSLLRGECSMALAAGVNLILSSRLTRAFHAAGMLSPDGRCKTFDAAADGYVRGEGCGAVVLKRLDAARRDGDRVIAVLRGSAVNQDGLSNGITAPNGPAQEAAIRAALEDAGLEAQALGYVETHGTGTELGDPIEVQALAQVLGAAEDRPLPLLGALKSNIGHLEAAAGIAGLIKAALVVSRGQIPANAHFSRPNPHLAPLLERLQPATTSAAWPAGRARRIAGVSSFGFGGTNAHLILEGGDPPAEVFAAAGPAGPEALCLSAGSEAGLRALAAAWRDRLAARPEVPARVWAANAATRRGQLAWRLAVAGRSGAEFADRLDAWLAGDTTAAVAGRAPKQAPARVGLALGEPKATGGTDGGVPQFLAELGLSAPQSEGPLQRFARLLSEVQEWLAWGLQPSAVAGTGTGAWAAAVLAGRLAPEAAVRALVEARHGGPSLPEAGGAATPIAFLDGGTDPAGALRAHGCDAVVSVPQAGGTEARLRALAGAWVAGLGADPAQAYADADVPVLELPLMRFERRLCWYDAPADGSGWLESTWQALGAAAPVRTLRESLKPLAALGAVRQAFVGAPAKPAPEDIQARLTEIVAELVGQPPAALDPHERFIEMGADSIVLATAMRRIEERFGVKLSIRQLFEETPDIASLAAYLAEADATGATETAAAPPAARTPQRSPPALAAASGDADLRRLFRQTEDTLQALIAQQAELRRRLDGGQAASPAPAPAPAPSSAPPAAAPSALPPWRRAAEPASTAERNQALARIQPAYTAKTPGSKRLAAAFRPRLADNRASAGFRFSTKEMVYPLVGERAEGAYLWDVDGNRYLDITMGFGAYLFGHAPDFVQAALRDELERGWALGPQARLAGEMAELVHALTGAERVAFCSTGSEAVMTALRLARTVTGRSRIALFQGAYHGHTDGVLAVPGAEGPVPMAPGVPDSAVSEVLVLPYGEPAALETLRAQAGDLAAILVEPVQSRRPDLQPGAFLRALREIADAGGAVLLFDEMITGFRIGAGGAQAHFGVQADLATYGKILGGGLPIGAVAGRADLLDALDGGQWRYGDGSYPAAETTFFAGTFNKHPLAMAPGAAVLRRIAERGETLYPALNARTEELARELDSRFAAAGSEMRVSRFGSLFRFAHADNADAFLYALRRRGLFIWEGRNCFLSTAHGAAEVAAILDAVEGALEDVTGHGADGSRPASMPAAAKETTFPLSAGQRQLCLLGELRPGAERAYHESAVLHLPSPPGADALNRAFAAVVTRHPALRTVLEPDENRQRVLGEADLHLELRDLPADTDSMVALAEAVAAPFPAGRPAVRLQLHRAADGGGHLLLAAHHAVADGRSLALVVHELAAALERISAGEPPQLPAAPDFAGVLSRQAERAAERTKALEDWRAVLGDPAGLLLELPTDRPRPDVASHAGDAVVAALPPELDARVAAAAKRQGATPFMVYLAAYLLLLHRLSGQTRLAVGVPSDGRIAEADAEVVGDCAQLLPIVSRLAPDDSFAGFLRRLRGTLLDAYDRQDFDFATLLESLDLPFDRARPTLLAAAFNLDQAEPLPAAFGPGAELLQVPPRFVKLDLWLNLTRLGDTVGLRLEYASELFARSTAERWQALYTKLLAASLEAPDRRPHDLPLWQTPLRGAPAFPAALPAGNPSDTFAGMAARAGSRIAIAAADGDLSYAELAQQVERLAAALAARGVGPEVRVGLCLAPGPQVPRALLAVLRAGGAYVPLEPDQPRRRLEAMAQGADCALILSDAANAEPARSLGRPQATLEDLAAEETDPAILERVAAPQPDQLAYVMHTSGSSGTPKAVGVPLGALTAFLQEMAAAPGLGADDRLLAVTPLGFDIAGLELLLPLLTGARLSVLPRAERGDPAAIVAALARLDATAMQATPATWRLLVEHGWRPPAGFKALCGGEALPPDLARQLAETGAELWNLYGPTETTVWSCRARLDTEGAVHLGAPLGGTHLALLDGGLDPVPEGAVGEIAIGGLGVARGYLGQPGLTAERFRPDPFAEEPGARLYLTGDLGRLDDDGRLHCLGRRDEQAKLRGHRIEPGEIAAALERQPDVAQAAVLVERRPSGRVELEAFLVCAGGAAPVPERLRAGLAEWLPSYMIPQRFHLVARLPLNANGKLDRTALRAQIPDAAAPPQAMAQPRGATETVIAEIWREVLEAAQVGAEQGFFDLGGTSLDLARAHDRIQARLGRRFPLALCVAFPTVRSLAAHLDGAAHETVSPAVAKAQARAARRRAALQVLRPPGADRREAGE